ncbi:hypothetical protein ACIPSA_13345 [Streptomyces sp. NPDC086549]|uniref:hypothetical protein n=1 Tax=Streptomyces sp. NPDC086549 TaxID=3365752 RepID=UPI003818F132
MADADGLLSDHNALCSGVAVATGLGDPMGPRNPPDDDRIPACLRRCAIDRKLGGAMAGRHAMRRRRSYASTAPRVDAEPAPRIHARASIPDSVTAVFEENFMYRP